MIDAEGIAIGPGRGEIIGLQWVAPYALSTQTGLKALHTYNGEQKPEKADQKRDADKERRGLFQTSQDNLRSELERQNGLLNTCLPLTAVPLVIARRRTILRQLIIRNTKM